MFETLRSYAYAATETVVWGGADLFNRLVDLKLYVYTRYRRLSQGDEAHDQEGDTKKLKVMLASPTLCIITDKSKGAPKHKIVDVCKDSGFTLPTYKFVGCSLQLNEENYDLNQDCDSFMVVGNKLFDYDFVVWYMESYHGVTVTAEDAYKITLMDHNMKLRVLDKTNHIVVGANDYNIITTTT